MKKKGLRTLAAAAALSTLFAVPAFAESAVVTGSEVNLRTGPGSGYRVIDTLPRNTEVEVVDRSNSSWYLVDYFGDRGFMSSAYLNVCENEQDWGGVQTSDSGAINAMYVRFRSGPGSGYSVLGEYNRGKPVSIVGEVDAWIACIIDGVQGYVYSDYVSWDEAAAVVNVVPRKPGGSVVIVDEWSDEKPVRRTSGKTVSQTQESAGETQSDSITFFEEPEAAENGWTEEALETEQPVKRSPAVRTQTEAPTASPAPAETQAPAPTPTPAVTPAAEEKKTDIPEPQNVFSAEGFITGDYVRFRRGAGTNYPIISSYNKGTALTVYGSTGDWIACTIEGRNGYVHSDYVAWESEAEEETPALQEIQAEGTDEESPEHKTATNVQESAVTPVEGGSTAGYITGNNVRMRSGPSMTSAIKGELFFGNAVTITGTVGDWTAVEYDGEKGYIYSQYVKDGEYSYNKVAASSSGSAEGKEIAEYALQFVGYNYTWGGASPATGFDCSGLVYYVYKQFGYTLNRVAEDQANNGVPVTELEPGDILCFYSGNDYIGHAGIYIGDGYFVHAQNSATGVVVTSLSGYYSDRGYEARRIV